MCSEPKLLSLSPMPLNQMSYLENDRDNLVSYECDRFLRRSSDLGVRALRSGDRRRTSGLRTRSGDRLRSAIGDLRRSSFDLDRRRIGGDLRSSLRRSFSRMMRLNASSGSSIMPVPILAATP